MLPYMTTKVKSDEETLKIFRGINRTENISEGELTESENLTSEYFPSLGTRKGRAVISRTERIINGLSSFGGCIYTSYSPSSGKLFLTYEDTEYEFTDYTDSPAKDVRKFASLSDSILIIPDNIIFYINTKEFSKVKISQSSDSTTTRKKFNTETNGSSLLDNASIRYIASFDHNSISFTSTNYTLSGDSRSFYYSNFDKSLKAGNIINIKMTVFSDNAEDDEDYKNYVEKMKEGISVKIRDIVSVTHTVYTGKLTETVKLIFDDNTIDTGGYRNLRISKIALERDMPALDNICSYNNRIWAISGNEIYTSKLGDPSEWNDFSTDIYGILPNACFSTKAETEGDFTGIIPYNNYIFAFKENAIHKVYGESPDEYTLYTKICSGVGKDMGQCVCTGENSIIYPSSNGIYIYSDDYPICISQKLDCYLSPIDACSDNRYYYILAYENDIKKLFVYDLKKKIWHTETVPADSLFLTSYGKDVYLATQNSIILFNADASKEADTENVRWHFKMRFDDRLFDKKGYGSLSIRYSLAQNASFTVRAKYDDQTKGALCGAVYDESHAGGCVINLPIKRCLWFELEFSGMGEFMLKSLMLKFYRGSEI